MSIRIINNRIEGTRTTVWMITHFLEGGDFTLPQIAEALNLSLEQVEAAVRYIEENKEEVWAGHREIEERIRRGNPPELQARLDATHLRFQEMVKARQLAKQQESNGEGHPA